MIPREIRDRLRGFLDYAEMHLERGNDYAVREALEDARALVRSCAGEDLSEDEIPW
jgi:hypothetical protein